MEFGEATSYFLEHGGKRHDSKAIWRSLVHASMVPPTSVRKKSAGGPCGLHKKIRRDGGYRLREGGWELERNGPLGDSVGGDKFQGQLVERFQKA
jgi:hypothetical protein